MKKIIALLISHGAALLAGFALGIYLLPILIAPKGPSIADVEKQASQASYSVTIPDSLKGSDFLHWGKGKFSISPKVVTLMGEVAPGPDYKLYLTPKFVETEAEFLAIKGQSRQVGDIKTFKNFIVNLPDNTPIDDYTSVVVWCESFGEFITAAQYRK